MKIIHKYFTLPVFLFRSFLTRFRPYGGFKVSLNFFLNSHYEEKHSNSDNVTNLRKVQRQSNSKKAASNSSDGNQRNRPEFCSNPLKDEEPVTGRKTIYGDSLVT